MGSELTVAELVEKGFNGRLGMAIGMFADESDQIIDFVTWYEFLLLIFDQV